MCESSTGGVLKGKRALEKPILLQPSCRDPKDNKFLALTQVCGAHVLISSDDDLRVLNPWRQVPVLSASAFLSLVAA